MQLHTQVCGKPYKLESQYDDDEDYMPEQRIVVIYQCQACGKEFDPCEYKVPLNPIEAESDDYYPRQCPIEMDTVAWRRISPPRNREPAADVTEHQVWKCHACSWVGVTLRDGGCPECRSHDLEAVPQ